MIAFVSGNLTSVTQDCVVVENGGVGFEVFVPASTVTELPHIGQPVTLHTHLYVKEDVMALYGFCDRDALQVFRLLITVSGIGPKGALGILSVLSPNDLRFAVAAGDDKAISQAPGIGKKTAQKMILELKDKLKLEDTLPQEDGAVTNQSKNIDSTNRQEAILALTALGYGNTQAAQAVMAVESGEEKSVEQLLKEALKHIGI